MPKIQSPVYHSTNDYILVHTIFLFITKYTYEIPRDGGRPSPRESDRLKVTWIKYILVPTLPSLMMRSPTIMKLYGVHICVCVSKITRLEDFILQFGDNNRDHHLHQNHYYHHHYLHRHYLHHHHHCLTRLKDFILQFGDDSGDEGGLSVGEEGHGCDQGPAVEVNHVLMMMTMMVMMTTMTMMTMMTMKTIE